MKSFTTASIAYFLLNAGVSLASPTYKLLPLRHATQEKRQLPFGTIITGCSVPGTVALTYDDGPFDYTSQLLDILDSYGAKATFFINGNNRGQGGVDAGILQRMNGAGHQLATHTWGHVNLDEASDDLRRSEMSLNEQIFLDIFGWAPTYMRPPYLACSAESGCLGTMADLGYHVINCNVDTKDYMYNDPALIQQAKDRYSEGISPGGDGGYIVLAHDIHYQTVFSLTSYMIETASERGYRLVTVGECLGDPRENWYRGTGTGGGSGSGSIPSEPSSAPSSAPTSGSTLPETPSGPVSTDATCGGSNGYTCQGSGFGNCCSQYGWCGSTSDYCGAGCNSKFGSCTGQSSPQPDNSQTDDSQSDDSQSGGSDIKDTADGRCGPQPGTSCVNWTGYTCCSQYGYCGNTPEHCGAGCQSAFGQCN